MAQVPPRNASTARHLAALALAAVTLAACSFSPLGQAETPTSVIPTPEAATPTAASVDSKPAAPRPPAEPTVALSAATPSGQQPAGARQLTELTGSFTYTNDIITTYYVEHAAALVDMYGFVHRDKEWLVPVDSQILGFMKLDEKSKSGEYHIQLPELPRAQFVDVNHD